MAATVTLDTTTTTNAIQAGDLAILLDSVTNVLAGRYLYVERELMKVRSIGIGTSVNVNRGIGGTATTAHASGATVTIGKAHQFYSTDPTGMPGGAVEVDPYINVLTGVHWTAQGDEDGPGVKGRWGAPKTTTRDFGALGVRTTVRETSKVTD